MDQLIGIAIVVSCIALPWLTWVSVQSLIQASLLRKAAKGLTSNRGGQLVAVHGKVLIRSPLQHRQIGEVLWYKWTAKERYDDGESRGWRTVGDETAMAEFSLQTEAGEIVIEDFPTEFHGAKTRSSHDSPTERSTIKWLPVRDELTVVGLLVRRLRGLSVIKSKKAGLLFSHRKPDEAAIQEALKGILGLIVVAAALVTGLCFWMTR